MTVQEEHSICFNDKERYFKFCKSMQHFTDGEECKQTNITQTCLMQKNEILKNDQYCPSSYISFCEISESDKKRNKERLCSLAEKGYSENCICDYLTNKIRGNPLISQCVCYPLYNDEHVKKSTNESSNKKCVCKKLIRKVCSSQFEDQNNDKINVSCVVVNNVFLFENKMNCFIMNSSSTSNDQQKQKNNQNIIHSDKIRNKRSNNSTVNATESFTNSSSALKNVTNNATTTTNDSKTKLTETTSIIPISEIKNVTQTPFYAMYKYSLSISNAKEDFVPTPNTLNQSIKNSKGATIPIHIAVFFLAFAAVISLYFYKKREKVSKEPKNEEKPEEDIPISRNSRGGSFRNMNRNVSDSDIMRRNSYINTCMKYDDEWGIGKRSKDEKKDEEENKGKKDNGHHVRFSKLIIRGEDGTKDEVLLIP